MSCHQAHFHAMEKSPQKVCFQTTAMKDSLPVSGKLVAGKGGSTSQTGQNDSATKPAMFRNNMYIARLRKPEAEKAPVFMVKSRN